MVFVTWSYKKLVLTFCSTVDFGHVQCCIVLLFLEMILLILASLLIFDFNAGLQRNFCLFSVCLQCRTSRDALLYDTKRSAPTFYISEKFLVFSNRPYSLLKA